MPRLFFALQPPAIVAAQVLAGAQPWLQQLQATPVPVGNLHATLCFLGNVDADRLARLRAVAAGIRGPVVKLEFDQFDYWRKPRVLCACASRESAPAAALSAMLGDATLAAEFKPDVKPFRAHLTLARKIPPARAADIAWPQKVSPGFVVRCEEFVLMESRRGEQGSIYSVIDSWPLYEFA